MADKCGYKWWAPYLEPPVRAGDTPVQSSREQKCSLEKDHKGDHMSDGKVTARNLEETP